MPAEVRLDWEKLYPYILPGFKHIDDESRTSSKKRKIQEISRSDEDEDEITQKLELEISSQRSSKRRHLNHESQESPVSQDISPQASANEA